MPRYDITNGTTSNGLILRGENIYISSGGMTDETRIDRFGSMYVLDGGIANNTVLDNYSYILVSSGGLTNDTKLGSYCIEFVSAGGTANSTVVSSDAIFHVLSAATANIAVVDFGGKLFVSSGGTATGIMENGGYVEVANGASATFVANLMSGLILSSSIATVHSGTTADNTQLHYSGLLQIFSGGTAKKTILRNSGTLTVSSGGTVNDTTVFSGAFLVSSGAVASNVIMQGGSCHITFGGKLTGRVICLSGAVFAYGGTVDFDLTEQSPGKGARINNLAGIQGSPYYSITVKDDQAEGVYTLADGAGAFNQSITVMNAGGATLGTLSLGGTITISGVSYSLNLSDGTLSLTIGTNHTPSPYTSDGLNLINGSAYVYSDQVFHDTFLASAYLYVNSGGVVDKPNVNCGGSVFVYSGASVTDADVYYGGMIIVSNGGQVKDATLNSNCYILVSSGGTANGTTVYSSGIFEVFGPGFADNTTVEKGAYAGIFNGSASNTVINGGKFDVSGGAVTGVKVNPTGSMFVSGGLAWDIRENGGYVSITSTQYLTFTPNAFSGLVLARNSATVHSGTTANCTTINSNGILYVFTGGIANDVTVNSNGTLHLSSGGTGSGITVNSSGNLMISSGGTATAIMENGGYVDVADGASATFVANTLSGTVFSSASATIHSGTTADSVMITSNGRLHVFSGGTARNAFLMSSGNLMASAGGIIHDTILSGGTLHVSTGAVASNVIMHRGNLNVSFGGKLTGRLICLNGTVSAFGGATVDFDLTRLQPESVPRINNLAAIQGSPFFTVTVKDDQAEGVYALASGAGAFDQAITVVNTGGAAIGMLSVGGTAIISGVSYALDLSDDTLVLRIGTESAPFPYTSNGLVLVSASASVESDQIFHETLIAMGGSLHVSSGGTADTASLFSSGCLIVSSGGTATQIEENGGYVDVQDGATFTFVPHTFSGTSIYQTSATVHSGTTALNAWIGGSSGTINVYSSGVASNVSIGNNGLMNVFDGGHAISTFLNYGSMTVSSGGTIDHTIFEDGGILTILSGGIANDIFMNSASLVISSGGTANKIKMEEWSYLHISGGGMANDITMKDGAVWLSPGARTENVILNQGAYITVESDSIALGLKENGGCLRLDSEGTATIVSNSFSGVKLSNEEATVHSGTTAYDTMLTGWGNLKVFSGGIASGVTLSSGGTLTISSGGTATDVAWTPFKGRVHFDHGATVTFTSRYSGVYYGYESTLVSSTGKLDSVSLDGSYEMYAMSGGTATNVSAIYSGALHVFSGGTANSAFIDSHGSMWVYSGGTANDAMISYFGSMWVYSGGSAHGTIVSSYGGFHVLSGGTATDIVAADSAALRLTIAPDTYFTGTYKGSSIRIEDGRGSGLIGFYMDVSSGGTADSVSIDRNGVLTIYSGGIAQDAIVNYLGNVVVSGGIANSAAVFSNGSLDVRDGRANNATVNSGGAVYVRFTGIANNASINSQGSISVFSGGTANDILVYSGGLVRAACDGAVNDMVNSGGTMRIESGGTANNARFASGGWIFVSSGGTASNTAVNSNGYLEISAGGMTDRSTVNSGGRITVSSGGTANNTTLNRGGDLIISSGGQANGIDINKGGRLMISIGATANNASVFSGGLITVSSDGIANSAAVFSFGQLVVSSGGTAVDAVINSGGSMNVESGGTAAYAEINSAGILRIESGGQLTSATVQSGGRLTGYFDCRDVTFDSGATLYFDISAGNASDNTGAIVNLTGLSPEDSHSFSILISDFQEGGVYKLAEGAWGFDQTVSVVNAFKEFGSVSVGQSVWINDKEYALNLNDGELTLTINVPTKQYVYLDFDGESLVNYTNSDLGLSFDLSVLDPEFSDEQREAIVYELTNQYKKFGIEFTLTPPAEEAYSTLYFGLSDAFSDYGEFFGIAETYDANNRNKNDNAFILLDQAYSTGQILSVTSNMLDLILGRSYFVDGTPNIRQYAETKYLLSTDWHQREPYNQYCPIDPRTETRSITGCTNTAAAQIIYYWLENGMLDFTLTLEDSDAYTKNKITIDASDDPVSGHLSFAEANELLSNLVLGDDRSIAALCFAAGVVQKASYSSSETSTAWNISLFVRSGFDDSVTIKRMGTNYWPMSAESYQGIRTRLSDEDYLVQEILQGRPVGITIKSINHAIVLDGYDSSINKFHFNYGWGDWHNVWYALDEINVLNLNEAIYGVTPVVSPDLTLNDLSVEDLVVNLNEDVALSFTVSNEGKEVSKETLVCIYCGDVLLDGFGLDYISPGYSREVNCSVNLASLPVGENVLTVKIGSQNAEEDVSSISVTIDHRDNPAPRKPTASADIVAPTNTDVLVSAAFSRLAAEREYSFDGDAWSAYTEPVRVGENRTVFFRCADEAGNVSEITSYAVTNIDKIAPDKPTFEADVTSITNGDVKVSAAFSSDSVKREYSLDGQTWNAYTDAVTFAENGTAYFRGTDAAGNISEVATCTVGNIDKTAPDKPVAVANITAPTRGKVAVTATFSQDSVAKEYSLDGENWGTYVGAIYFVENGKAYFRSRDNAGNISDVTIYEVDNIDTVAPAKPIATGNITSPTNGAVTVEATFSDDTATKEYSFDNWTWMSYSEGIRMTENGAVFFRGMDVAGNISDVERYLVNNIDKVAPVKPSASANITTITNKDVQVSAVFSDDTAEKQYSLDGQTWLAYTEAVKVSENGTIFFRGIDAAGNASEATAYEVTNIDKTAPVAPTASANTTDPTNQNVIVTATFSEDSVVREYSLNGRTWLAYSTDITLAQNGAVFFHGIDAAGNVSDETVYTVSNIDRIAPTAPTASADITAPTNTDVLVTAVFSDDSVKKEYSFDGTTWRTYSTPILFVLNGIVYFRGTDAAGNVSDITSYEVTNIDKVAPDKPIATADITDPTNTNVRVSAIFNAKSVTKEYSLDGNTWVTYTGSVEFSDNGTVYFRSWDAAGNKSEVTSYEVKNIDRIAPEKPTAAADITDATNGEVLVSAQFSADSVTKEYSLDGTTWKPYTDAISFSANGTVFFRGTDVAGNISDVASYEVNNIDKVAPVKPTASADVTAPTNTDVFVSAQFSDDSVAKEYSIDGENWLSYSDAVKVSDNGTVFFRGTDEAGNISEIASYTVRNIDKIAPEKPVATANITAPTRGKVSVTATFSEDSVAKEYSLDGENWGTYVGAITFVENGKAYFRSRDNAGNKSEITVFEVGNIDTVAPEKPTAFANVTAPTNQDVTVTAVFSEDTAVKEYSFDNWTWMEYADGVTMKGNGVVYFRGKDVAGNISAIERYEVTNIDRIAPVKPTAVANIATPTNTDVVVTATFSEDSMTREFRIGDGEWTAYTDGVTLTENSVVYFRGADEAGNVSEITSYIVRNIDKVAPVIVLVGDTTTPLQASTLTASTEAGLDIFFSTDGETWMKYTGEIAVTANGTYSFKATDAAGNIGTAEKVFGNIDTTAPEKPVAVASITAPTNTDVTVTATFSEDSLVKEYSVNGREWKPYSAAILFAENGSVAFRGTDAAGNISEVTTYTVGNIDKIAPEKPTATADITAPTNTDVLVSAVFSDDSVVREYSLDGETWLAYTAPVKFEENGSVFFRGEDDAGNISEGMNFLVNNIDKVAPTAPIVSADITNPTNTDVSVSAVFSDDSVVKEYSLDGQTWIVYTGAVKFADNGSVFFRGMDEAGNVSEVASYTVSNIDKVAPEKPVASVDVTQVTNSDVLVTAQFSDDSVTKEYSLDGQNWLAYTDAVKFEENGSVSFRGIDEAGNISEIETVDVSNIDKVAPTKPMASADVTAATNGDVLVSAVFSNDSVVKEYSLDGETWATYTGAVKFTANGSVFFRGTDEAGNISEVTNFLVSNIDKVAPVISSTSISQGADDYVFAATATASDDRTAAADLGYSIRYAASAETLPEIEPINGLSFTLNPSDAGKMLYYQAGVADNAGNITWTEAKAFTVSDHTAPVLNGLPQAEFKNRMVFVSWDPASDNIGVAGYRLTLNNETYELQEPGFVLEGAGPGSYTYQVTAYDEAGYEAKSEVGTLTVENRADLYIASVRILKNGVNTTTISTKDEVELSIQIGNMGDVNAAKTVAAIYCGELLLTDISVSEISVGGLRECTYTIAAGRMSTGIQDIRVEVNSQKSIAEYDESNNVRSLTLNVENTSLSDLVIGSIGLDKSVYSAEDNAVLSFTVRNIGYSKASSASKVFIYDGETSLGYMDVEALEAATGTDAMNYTIEAGRLFAGSHMIRVVADAEKTVPETNEENNGAQVQLVVGQCDLGISKLAISQDVCDTGDAVTVSFTVRNSGTDKAAASVAGIYDGNKLLGTVEIGELSAGLSVSKQFVIASGMLEAGLHTLRVVADSGSSVAESDETNNVRSVSLQVNLKDDVAPVFTGVSIHQGAEDYSFAVTASATDNITPASELVYGIRYAETAEGLESAGILNGTEFSLTPEYAGKTLYYQVSATDLAGNTAWSEVRTFTVADNSAPDILNLSVSTTDATLRLLWDAADNVGVTSYKIYLDDELVSTQETTSYTQEGVFLGRHTYRIDAYDAAGNMSSTGNMKVNFDDTIAPVIESVRAEQTADGYGITFAVTATDNETQAADIVSRVQYAFSAEDVQNAPLNGLNLALAPEDAGRTLYYRVSASDEAGNTVWTDIHSLAIADKTAPKAPTDLVGSVNGSGVTLNWTASTDNVGVAGYQVRCGATETLDGDGILVAGNQYALTGLKEGVYYWQTAAVDAAGNVSEWSEVKSFRILPEDMFGPVNTAERACDLGTLSGEQTLTGGAISSADDADWFKFTLNTKGTANDYVQIAFDNRIGDLDLYLYSSNGTTLLLTADGSTGDTEKISLKNLQKGTYLLKVVGKNGAMNTFSISTKKVAGYDMDVYDANGRNDSLEAATVFDIEKTPQATVSGLNLHEAGDVDYYQFTLANMGLSGDGVSISFENSVGDLDLVLFDAKGVKIAESAGTANVETISFNGLAAGSYYVQVVAAHNAVNEYTLNWNFATNKVESDALEGQEPYAITESVELANLSISAAGGGVTQEDTFSLSLNQPGSATSKIRFSNYRSDWNGLKYVVKDSDNSVVLSGIGSEISLDGLAAGDYSLTVDTPVAGSFSSYDISVSLPESAGTKWTYMVYMAADSNLDTYALYDLIAMQQADLDSQIDIYVMVDRSATSAYDLSAISTNKWDTAWSDTRVGKITYNPGSTVSVDWESWGELDTSSMTTLKQFVDWAQNQSKSENYGLLMWDHGTEDGSLCVDGTTDADWGTSLSISELSAFLSEKGNIPLVIFNNCLLGSEIVATQMTGSTEVIVVSEAESHPQNSTYAYKDFFSTITADMTAEEMAKVLVQNVRQYGDGSQPSMLSAVDVTDSRLATALEALAEAVSASNNDNDKIVLINGLAKTLQDGCAYAGSTVYQSDLYDMIVQAMADRRYDGTSEDFKTALNSLKSILEDVVLTSKSVPANRGYGIATFNPVLTVKTYAASGYSTQKVSELIQSYLDANYAANPAWAGLLSDLAKTYQNQFGSSIRTASFSVSSIVDIGRDELISSMDLGCFSGRGEVIDGISLLGDLFLGVTITSEATSTGRFVVVNDMGAAVTISILAEDGSLVKTGTNSVEFSKLAAGDYYILLQGNDDCTVTLSFEANWTTGVDRFDYAQSKVNEKFANGNGSIAKASALAAGYYSGLLTYQGDTDWYQIGNVYTEKYKVVLEGAAGMTVAEYDADGKLVQTAKYANGKYTMTVKSMNYLFVEGSADLNLDQVNAYSVDISGVQAGAEEEEDIIPPTAPVASADVTTATNGNVIVSAVFSDDSAVKEYSLDGVNWQAYPEGGVIIIINGTVSFRAFDEAGNVSEVTDFLVSNIDKTAPTVPSGLQAVVADQTVTLSWASSTDDLAGVKEYVVKYSHDGQEFTLTTAETSLVLENVDFATWQWNVTAFDAVGNASEVTAGEAFTVEEAVGPETRTFNLFTGRFAGGSQAMLANEDKGVVTIYANGTVWGTELVLDPGWKIAGVGDFDANGQDDFLRVNSEGYVVGEKTQTNGMFEVQVLNFRNAGWSILGTGDFNGNGSDDVLIANPTAASDTVGLLGYWESGVTWTLINGYSAEWEMIATGDYNADGKCDMLWRNSFIGEGGLTYNAFCTWIVEPPAGQSDWRMVSVANPAEWNFLCAGDFNGDDANDIAMINDVGVVGIWGVEDGWLSSWSILSAVNTSEWTLAGVGDFNADGTDDIAWVNNASGMAGYWQIEDKTLASWQNIATIS